MPFGLPNPVGTDRTYSYSYDVYPQDLGTEQQPHIMKLTAYTGMTLGIGGGSAAYSALLFIPSGAGSGGGGIYYEDSHEYTEMKLTNPIRNFVGVAGLTGLARRAIRPGIQVIYRSTDLREFLFSILFTPSSEEESQSMKSIVRGIRQFGAPDISGPMFITPAEWEINFYFNGQENTNIPKIKRCQLLRSTVDYTTQGEWSTFHNGHPVACMMTLAFKEMEIISRNYVQQGF